MKLSVLALDYDGTIAHRDALEPSVRAAIAEARTAGITVLLVTGRILDELRRVAGDLYLEMISAVRARYDLTDEDQLLAAVP